MVGISFLSIFPMEQAATTFAASSTLTLENADPHEEPLVLRLRAPATPAPYDGPRVTWAEGVIDNEHMGRLKSNCCCIYTKPRVWDDPSTWEQDENETEHCRGHTLPPPPKRADDDKKPSEDDAPPPSEHGHGCC